MWRVVVLMRVHSAEQKRRALTSDVAPCACSTVLSASAERLLRRPQLLLNLRYTPLSDALEFCDGN